MTEQNFEYKNKFVGRGTIIKKVNEGYRPRIVFLAQHSFGDKDVQVEMEADMVYGSCAIGETYEIEGHIFSYFYKNNKWNNNKKISYSQIFKLDKVTPVKKLMKEEFGVDNGISREPDYFRVFYSGEVAKVSTVSEERMVKGRRRTFTFTTIYVSQPNKETNFGGSLTLSVQLNGGQQVARDRSKQFVKGDKVGLHLALATRVKEFTPGEPTYLQNLMVEDLAILERAEQSPQKQEKEATKPTETTIQATNSNGRAFSVRQRNVPKAHVSQPQGKKLEAAVVSQQPDLHHEVQESKEEQIEQVAPTAPVAPVAEPAAPVTEPVETPVAPETQEFTQETQKQEVFTPQTPDLNFKVEDEDDDDDDFASTSENIQEGFELFK